MTTFKGVKSGFNRSGSNMTTPNADGAPKTKFMGRGGLGTMKNYPGGASNISGGNRRTAKSNMGDNSKGGARFSTTGGNAFGRGKK